MPSARLPRRLAVVSFVLVSSACAGPPVPSSVTGEPVCPDFELGVTRTKMRGGLRLPVALTIKQGDRVLLRTIVVGLRSADDAPTRIVLADANEEYTVEWAQCENERAPRPLEGAVGAAAQSTASPRREPPTEYACGNANVYKSQQLVTKKGDLSSHALAFPAPPNPACWAPEVAPTSADTSAAGPADAGAPHAEADSTDAGAASEGTAEDAGVAADGGQGGDGGKVTDAGAKTPTADGGVTTQKKTSAKPE